MSLRFSRSKSGELQGNPKIITRSTPNGLDLLKNNITELGNAGSAREMFFDPLIYALSDELNINPGFMRPDAFFVLIIVSDSYDQSKEASGFKAFDTIIRQKAYDINKALGYAALAYPEYFSQTCKREEATPDNLMDFMLNFTNSLNTKIGGGVSFRLQNPNVPKRFQNLTNVFSLCDPDFGQKFANIGEDIRTRVSDNIFLPVRPVDGTIRLKYGDQVIDNKWWKYDLGTNSIILDPLMELDETQADPRLFIIMDQANK